MKIQKTQPTTNLFGPLKRRRTSPRAPWGYKISDIDPELWEPVPEKIEALLKAYDYVSNHCSYREVARWLSETTGDSISYNALKYKVLAIDAALRGKPLDITYRAKRNRGTATENKCGQAA